MFKIIFLFFLFIILSIEISICSSPQSASDNSKSNYDFQSSELPKTVTWKLIETYKHTREATKENNFGQDGIFTKGKYLNTEELINKRGLDAEVYEVKTEDDYIIRLTRIVPPKKILEGSFPVYLQHGYLASSDQWVLRGRNNALAFILADMGIDVFLGDQRGNCYSSSGHSSKEKQYWDFSIDESGLFDVTAFITAIIEITNAAQVYYIGHSMGTTVYLAMASQRSNFAQKYIRLAILLSPVYIGPEDNLRLKTLLSFISLNNKMHEWNKNPRFMPRSRKSQMILQYLCSLPLFTELCILFVALTKGSNIPNLDRPYYGLYLSSAPSGTSLKTSKHLLQLFKRKEFRKYDYDNTELNQQHYKADKPPEYNLNNINVPTVLVYGNNDYALSKTTVANLQRKLGNASKYEIVEDPKYTHFDYLLGLNAKELIYNKIVKLLNQNIKDQNKITLE